MIKNRLQQLNEKSKPIKEICMLNTELYNDAECGIISWNDFHRLSKLCLKRYAQLQEEITGISQEEFYKPAYKVNKGY